MKNKIIARMGKNNLTMKQFNNSKSQKGFTLIELLVVIAIIGVLASFLIANFVSIRERARDGERKSDIYNIQAALEIFRSDQGRYPTDTEFPSTCGPTVQFIFGGSTYMQSVPCDPINTSPFTYQYTYVPADGTYTLIVCLENTSDAQKDPTNNSKCTSGVSFTLKNP